MKEILFDGAKKLGIEMDNDKADKLIKYAQMLVEWNEKINLTAITDKEGIATKHFLDSMSATVTGKLKGKVIDVGCGAGFPGLVLKIVCPEIELVLFDSLKKRITFLDEVIKELGLSGVKTVHMRAEDGGKSPELRAGFDTVVSRAVANMGVLSEWCIPFLKEGGYFLALKGPAAEDEIKSAKRGISILGGEVEEIMDIEIPFTDLSHKIVIVKKVRQTPMKYPRKPGIATKNPVGSCYNLSK